ncbi:oxidoreductase, 2OG-Fe(II) oxygenase family protein [Dictyocaulus viviparus]|uniref:Oxidoreductase, 2OG-Fe(II) oxygenase family protein n=1 Tax=Dictyocaulus viviparus TaxID=29172 RepID=A0A0D8Y422_DICVI|nr:oxidoreductase, 2OG-Fe(II) oxygenase family protein [Dictyocaulus viviparus]
MIFRLRLNTEILNLDPFLIVFRGFSSRKYIDEFLADINENNLVGQTVLKTDEDVDKMNTLYTSRQANGTWFAHQAKPGVAKNFRRIKHMIPFINFDSSEYWQKIFQYSVKMHIPSNPSSLRILSYKPGGHYAPHYDYINYSSTDQWDLWMKILGNRFATLLLILKTADKGGGTLFPVLNITIMPSPGDVILWTNVDSSKNMEERSLHGACPIWEGEKIAATLWIRFKNQDMLESLLDDHKFDLEKLIHPRPNFLGMTPIYSL